jgi:gluconokinase
MIVVLMGVSGSGKSHIGRLLAADLGWPFIEGDDLHPPANIARMASGVPLTDREREPWLEEIRRTLTSLDGAGESAVLACSALRKEFRQRLAEGLSSVRFVFLAGSYELILERLRARRGHFMPPALLRTQFATLEIPEESISIDVSGTPEEIVAQIRSEITGEELAP